ncbi:MAG: hypothetical protein WDM85_17365 [Caulobacteraceae bacterium]
MLRLNLIVHNPAGDAAITWIGVIILAALAAMLVGLWVFVASGRGRRDDDAGDPALDALRRRRLVVRRSGKARGPQATDVVELEPTADIEPKGS